MKPTIIFVHGLWADGSSWNKVIPPLLKQGYNVISVQNPTTSLEEDVAATQRAIKLAGGDVILVAHSWGGFVITEAGHDPHVKALVYVAAYAPDKGETVLSVSDKASPTQLTSFLQTTDGFVTLSKDGVTKAFANGLPTDEQNIIFCVQQPASPECLQRGSQSCCMETKTIVVCSGCRGPHDQSGPGTSDGGKGQGKNYGCGSSSRCHVSPTERSCGGYSECSSNSQQMIIPCSVFHE